VASSAPVVTEHVALPRSSKGARTRARLLDAAKEVFEADGFLNARISDISERAGLSHGSFYHYFESKEQIFHEVAEAVHDRLGAAMADVILRPGSELSPYERLRQAIRQHFASYRAEAKFIGLIEQVSRYDEHVEALMLRRHRRYSDEVTTSIQQLQRRGLADKSLDPALTAAAIDSMTGRFAELWLVQGALDIDFDVAADQMAAMVANILGVSRT